MNRETKLSTSDYTMETKIFENVLQQVKLSRLNFRLDESPFSAVINLRKSFIKDKSGIVLRPPPPLIPELDKNKILQLEKVVQSLQNDLESAVDDCGKVYKYKAKLEGDLDIKSKEIDQLLAQNQKLIGETKNIKREKIH